MGRARSPAAARRETNELKYRSITIAANKPNYIFTKILELLAFVIPYGNADEANHALNENLTLE